MTEKLTDKASKTARTATRLAMMMRGKRQLQPFTLRLPGSDIDARVVVLTCTEIDEAHASAFHYLVDTLKLDPNALVNRQIFQDEVITQVLTRALRDPADIDLALAQDAQDARDNFTADERAMLYERYFDYQAQIDPNPALITPEIESLLEDAVKKKDGVRLKDFGSTMLSSYLLILDSRRST